MVFRNIIALIFLFFSICAHAQTVTKKIDLFPPISGPLFLSGAFGEIRSDHFHSGVDFRTGGKGDAPVFSSEKGFVSRIKVSGSGFGKAIYIDHPNGYTTVYAHLNRYTPEIERFVKEQQYKQLSFEIDVYLKPNEIKVERGQMIAWSGNTGSSGGPHLHYEVRRTSNQMPINPSLTNLPINDIIKPSIRGVWIYNLDSSLSTRIVARTEVAFKNNGEYISTIDTIYVWGTIGLAVKAYDYINEGSIRCGINGITLMVNENTWFSFKIDGFMFSDTRYVNSHIDYEMRQSEGKRIHKLFRDPNMKLNIYNKVVNQGRITVAPDSVYIISISVEDSYGNVSRIKLILKGKKHKSDFSLPRYENEVNRIANWSFLKENSYKSSDLSIDLPGDALYNDLEPTLNIIGKLKGAYSPVYQIHNRQTPLHKPIKISIRVDSIPDRNAEKLLLGTFTPKGEVVAAGGTYQQGWVTASVRNFGDYFIIIDTVPPSIKPINIANGKNMAKERQIRLKVDDNLSGISNIFGTINSQWVLFEYDPKNNLIFYEFDGERLAQNKNHKLEVTLTDQMGNKTIYRCNFIW
jgi:murein DD-endopeptidase MepM/ murein hydrolase activator NlpD